MRLKPGSEGIDCTRTRIQQHALRLAISAALATGVSAVVQAQDFPAVTQLSALDGSNGFKLDGEAAYDRAGYSVSDAGDVNGGLPHRFLSAVRGLVPGAELRDRLRHLPGRQGIPVRQGRAGRVGRTPVLSLSIMQGKRFLSANAKPWRAQ